MIVIFNGPPGSGKDEAASWFVNNGFSHLSFKEELFKETIKLFDVNADWFMERCRDRATKEVPTAQLGHMSCREAMIYTSEKVIKPKYGKSYFGDQVASQIEKNKNYVISDGGFVEEILPLIEKSGVENITLVQLVREGCSYSSDSRRYFNGKLIGEFVIGKELGFESQYILEEDLPISTYRIYNNGTIESFHKVLENVYEIVMD